MTSCVGAQVLYCKDTHILLSDACKVNVETFGGLECHT